MKYNCHAGFGSISFNLAIQSKQDSGHIKSKWNTHTLTHSYIYRAVEQVYWVILLFVYYEKN